MSRKKLVNLTIEKIRTEMKEGGSGVGLKNKQNSSIRELWGNNLTV